MRRKRVVGIAVAVVVVVGAAAAIGPQFAQRAQMRPHPAAEYVPVPGTYRVGWWRTSINRHHMRAVEADAYDVLVIGDSVVFGWARIDQGDIATSVLGDRLGAAVGNVSAGSWGPPNQLGYVETFGLFGARVVVVVWSSHDAADVPGMEDRDEPREQAMEAAATLLERIRASGAVPIVALHRETHEVGGEADAGYGAFEQLAVSMGVEVVHLHLPLTAYKDNIHPTAEGQRLLADQLEGAVRRALGRGEGG